jgi:hypothetical protein
VPTIRKVPSAARAAFALADAKMVRALVGLLFVFRHGQRPPYPPPFARTWGNATNAGWSTREFTDMTPEAWNMSEKAFNNQELTGHGALLLKHMGEHAARRAAPLSTDLCKLPALLAADIDARDVQSAQAFAAGFFPPQCRAARSAEIIIANGSHNLHAVTSDDADSLCEPVHEESGSEANAELMIGSTAALTDRYLRQIRKVSDILGCCSPSLCKQYGKVGDGNCSIEELPYTYNGVYYKGLYDGPLQATSAFAQAWLLQVLSGFRPPAWGEVTDDDLQDLYMTHQRVMWLGSNVNRSVAAGSHLLGWLLANLEQLRDGSTQLVGAAQDAPPFVALFAHDFNLLYLRRLLRVSWLTDSWPFDTATTGSSISFELHREEADGSYHVLGVLEAASIAQQSSASSFLPPNKPPGRSVFFDAPLDDFRSAVLSAIEPRCIGQPLRQTILDLMQDDDPSAWWLITHSAEAIGIGVCVLIGGCLFGFLAGRAVRRHRSGLPLLSNKAISSSDQAFVLDPPPAPPGRANGASQPETSDGGTAG